MAAREPPTDDSPRPRVPSSGVWAPTVTFFDPDTDELDLDAQTRYFQYLARHLTGLVVLGTNSETMLLTREERAAMLRAARHAVGPGYELMAGVSGHSTRQVLEYIGDAAAAGADYALLLPCAYFGKQTTPQVVVDFYDQVAPKSALPINFPGVCNGVDLSSDTIIDLQRRHPNIVGTKLTCASIGKLTRLASELPRDRFAVFAGQGDILLAGLTAGGAGAISGLANVYPRTLRRIHALHVAGDAEGAAGLQRVAARGERLGLNGGVPATKYAAALTTACAAGVRDAEARLRPRRPYAELSEGQKEEVRRTMEEMVAVEETL